MAFRASTCEWTEDDNGAFDTQCNNTFEFTNDGPKENGFNFCPYCGGQLTLATTQENI